jgi:hypothetical protein
VFAYIVGSFIFFALWCRSIVLRSEVQLAVYIQKCTDAREIQFFSKFVCSCTDSIVLRSEVQLAVYIQKCTDARVAYPKHHLPEYTTACTDLYKMVCFKLLMLCDLYNYK